jgi:hypothetical protein
VHLLPHVAPLRHGPAKHRPIRPSTQQRGAVGAEAQCSHAAVGDGAVGRDQLRPRLVRCDAAHRLRGWKMT